MGLTKTTQIPIVPQVVVEIQNALEVIGTCLAYEGLFFNIEKKKGKNEKLIVCFL